MIRYVITMACVLFLAWDLTAQEANPPAPGFDEAGSDPKAVKIADRVMEALGGREAWDDTRYITWRFFGRRLHVWDKWTGDIRVEFEEGKKEEKEKPYVIVLANLNDMTGKAWKNGDPVTGDELKTYVQTAYEMWVNDSYWLVMPYKLKDSGVTLKHLGEKQTTDGKPADAIELTFSEVGVTPSNKYDVYVDRESGLVCQWSFYKEKMDEEPGFTLPWSGWKNYGKIMLPQNFGDRGHSDIAVFDELPRSVFESPDPVESILK